VRLDKWLWSARFFKTRGLAQAAIAGGRVKLNGERVKPAHAVKPSDGLLVRIGTIEWDVVVRGLSARRGPAAEASLLYEESAESLAARQQVMDQLRWGTEPSASLKGRPTKRDRRLLEKLSGREPDPVD